jgi:hypothetical protein
MANKIPKEFKKAITDVWITESVKVALLVGYTFVDGHYRYSDVSAWEHAVVPNYVAGGNVLVDTSAFDGQDAKYSGTNSTWTTVTLTGVNFAVVYNATTGLIKGLLDLGGSFSVVNGIFTLQWNASGIVKITQA